MPTIFILNGNKQNWSYWEVLRLFLLSRTSALLLKDSYVYFSSGIWVCFACFLKGIFSWLYHFWLIFIFWLTFYFITFSCVWLGHFSCVWLCRFFILVFDAAFWLFSTLCLTLSFIFTTFWLCHLVLRVSLVLTYAWLCHFVCLDGGCSPISYLALVAKQHYF